MNMHTLFCLNEYNIGTDCPFVNPKSYNELFLEYQHDDKTFKCLLQSEVSVNKRKHQSQIIQCNLISSQKFNYALVFPKYLGCKK